MKPFVTPGGVGDTYWIVSVGLKCVRTQGIESLLNLTPLYLSCLRMYVVSVSDISAVNSHVLHVMYQETRFLNQDACFLNQEGRRQFLISFVSEGD